MSLTSVRWSLAAILLIAPLARAVEDQHRGEFGDYPMTRDASGTSWQPESTPMEGRHWFRDSWRIMAHGRLNLVNSQTTGPRGRNQTYTTNMFMAEASRHDGFDALSFRFMGTLEPVMGPKGYPLLLQSGETANGRALLIDRQHPHDAIMELSTTYSTRQDEEHPTLFIYGGLPGEPALGPPAFMHRASGIEDPEAPISHHWQDSTHISYGVVTGGFATAEWKFEVSGFRGREPDQYHWDIERPKIDSFATRLSWNPSPRWALQASFGAIKSPDALAPSVDTMRVTASAMYGAPLADGGHSDSTLVWGRNNDSPGTSKDSVLAESSVSRGLYTFFSRGEWVQKDELLLALTPNDPVLQRFYPNGITPSHIPPPSGPIPPSTPPVSQAPVFEVGKISVGVVRDFLTTRFAKFGVGVMGSLYHLPRSLYSAYGSSPMSGQVWIRATF
ncbi:MAG: hypothetical protein ACHQ51_04710 [Elusimicrobiota bacterium]